MTLQNNDQFLVDRGNTPYSVDSQTLVAKLQDSDLMLVCRSGVPYKATGAEIKSSLGSPGVNPGLNDITLDPSAPGSGTEADPYILQTQVVAPYGSTTQSVETITIIGQPPEAQVIWKDSSVDAGSRFAQVTGELTDASGVWTGQLEYADIPDSTEDTTYVGKLSIGLVYFQWTITQKAVATSPTSVTNVSLIEADPEGDRFTSQSFVASSQVVDGEPISTKTFDAHVDGTLSKTVKFTEPLESSEVNSISGDWQSTLSSPTISNPQYAFNSNPNNFAASQDNITWATEGFGIVPSTIEWFDYAATDENRITFNYADGNSDVFFTQGTNDWYNIGCTNNGSVLTSVFIQINSGQFGYFNGIKINGDQVVTGEPLLSANLTFANGTDMEALAAGDTVNQTTNFTEPLESSSTGILYSDSTIPIGGNWQEPPAGAFQGISPATQSSYTGNTAWIENLPNTQIIVSFPNKVVPANGYVDVWTWSGQDDISVDFQDPSGNALGGVNSRTEYAQGNNNVKVFRFLPVADQLISAIVVSRGVGGAFMSAIDWNGTFLADEVAVLSFANGTDMSALEAGDVVSQSTSFTEPLESSGSTTAPTYVLTGATDPENAFDGDLNTVAYSFGTNGPLNFQVPDSGSYTPSDELVFYTRGGTAYVVVLYYTDGTDESISIPNTGSNAFTPAVSGAKNWTNFSFRQDASTGAGGNTLLYGVAINGSLLVSDAQITDLTFANGTDMEGLATGDTVNQINNFTEPLESSTSAVGPVYSDKFSAETLDGPSAFDGNTATSASCSYPSAMRLDFNPKLNGKLEIWMEGTGTRLYEISHGAGSVKTVYDNVAGWLDCGTFSDLNLIIAYSNNNTFVTMNALRLDGTILVDGAVTADLTFANGTDMSALAAGDAVSQAGGPNYKERTTYNDGANSLTEPEIDKFFDGNIDTYMVSLAGAWTAGGGNISIDLSTVPITDVKEVKFSFNKALLDGGEMTPSLYYNSTNQGSVVNMPRVDTGTHYLTTFTPGNAPLTQIGFYLLLNSTVNTDWETTSGIQVVKNDGTVEWLTSGGPTGTVGSITGTTATLSSSSGAWVNGEDVTTGDKTTTGTVAGVSDTTATLSNSSGSWVNGENVVGPQKTIVEENARLYCAFDSNGNVTDLQNNPQDPPYTTQDSDPGLTFTFPATFPSGQTPDEELPDGTTFTVEVTAANATSTDSKEATVQPEPAAPVAPLAGLTTLYTGNAATLDVVNGIDLVDNDGLVWIKNRDSSSNHWLTDTIRGTGSVLYSNESSDAQPTIVLSSFNSDGFTLPSNSSANTLPLNYATWTFGKAAGYFDVVQYTGNGAAAQTINHSLATRPGFVITKQFSAGAGSWICWHTGLNSEQWYITLDDAFVQADGSAGTNWAITDTTFNVCNAVGNNSDTRSYISYLFAEDTPGVIKCGVMADSQVSVDTGFKPQWLMIKNIDANGPWYMVDSKRVNAQGRPSGTLFADDPGIEADLDFFEFNDNGFSQTITSGAVIYIAIAAPPDTRSQTNEEFIESQAKFLTYGNRAEIKAGQEAEAKREEVVAQAESIGINTAEIRKLLGK